MFFFESNCIELSIGESIVDISAELFDVPVVAEVMLFAAGFGKTMVIFGNCLGDAFDLDWSVNCDVGVGTVLLAFDLDWVCDDDGVVVVNTGGGGDVAGSSLPQFSTRDYKVDLVMGYPWRRQ